jgi:hypothetical protein
MKCTLSFSVSIEAPGSAPVKFIGPVFAPMYRFEGLATRVYCLAPGERGVAVAQPFEVAPQFGSEDITVVRYGIAGRTAGDVIPADWVELRNVQVENEGAKSRVSGDIENASAVAGIAAVVFPKNGAGVPSSTTVCPMSARARLTAPCGTSKRHCTKVVSKTPTFSTSTALPARRSRSGEGGITPLSARGAECCHFCQVRPATARPLGEPRGRSGRPG